MSQQHGRTVHDISRLRNDRAPDLNLWRAAHEHGTGAVLLAHFRASASQRSRHQADQIRWRIDCHNTAARFQATLNSRRRVFKNNGFRRLDPQSRQGHLVRLRMRFVVCHMVAIDNRTENIQQPRPPQNRLHFDLIAGSDHSQLRTLQTRQEPDKAFIDNRLSYGKSLEDLSFLWVKCSYIIRCDRFSCDLAEKLKHFHIGRANALALIRFPIQVRRIRREDFAPCSPMERLRIG